MVAADDTGGLESLQALGDGGRRQADLSRQPSHREARVPLELAEQAAVDVIDEIAVCPSIRRHNRKTIWFLACTSS